MTDTEQKALALVNKVRAEYPLVSSEVASNWALCRAIEQHEAFLQEVSDAVEEVIDRKTSPLKLRRFIIPKPVDPLVEVMQAWWDADGYNDTEVLRMIMDERGYEIREKAGD